jgi:hypothetical protein
MAIAENNADIFGEVTVAWKIGIKNGMFRTPTLKIINAARFHGRRNFRATMAVLIYRVFFFNHTATLPQSD